MATVRIYYLWQNHEKALRVCVIDNPSITTQSDLQTRHLIRYNKCCLLSVANTTKIVNKQNQI